ncbi:hypothetical protein [Dysgonomonas sp. 511]|uniref:hypothetical protein n=1 Tax=Dysgonomonas sp. 511 TaxID=2302930 RepID=UPI0013D38940|nr:hypothetical protein [Dysgonomonas sp. 511]NDV78371.1 hypothetical protein [Dysgonomonas sp. 511]
MQTLHNTTDSLIGVMKDVMSSIDDVNAALQQCFKLISDSSEEDIKYFMSNIFALNSLTDIEKASLATTVCGYLVERGFPSEYILKDTIDLFDTLLTQAKPFYDMFYAEVRSIEENDENRDEKIQAVFSNLIQDKEVVTPEMYRAVTAIEKFYPCAISVFSIDKENFYEARERLAEKAAYISRYNQGAYWLNTLFAVLFDEPVIMIDIDREVGFEGRINGIVDNYQLQHLLMSLPILNDGKSAISEEDFAVVNGSGEQSTDRSIESKWNMYNLELCSQPGWDVKVKNQANPASSIEYRNCWIWSEGAPADISFYDGYRVILLGKPAYSRSSRVQRAFRNLKAGIEVIKPLSPEEIGKWLNNTI